MGACVSLPKRQKHSTDLFGKGMFRNLDETIDDQRQAVLLAQDGDMEKPQLLNDLGVSLHRRFASKEVLDDIEEAIKHQRQAVLLTPDDHPRKPGRLINFGVSLKSRFLRTGALSDLEEAIKIYRQALLLVRDEDDDKPGLFNNLGNCLYARFERTGALSDIEEAIITQKQAVSLMPDGEADKPTLLSNLGNSFQSRFLRTGVLSDIEEAVKNQRLAISLTPDGRDHKPVRLSDLGGALYARFQCTGALCDIEEAEKAQQEAVVLTPEGHPSRPRRLSSLALGLHSRFRHTGVLSDLDEAIKNQKQAISLIPDGHPTQHALFGNLGNFIYSRYQHGGSLSDLEEAMKKFQQALSLIPEGHPDKVNLLTRLSISFHSRFEQTEVFSDLKEAISHQQQALSLAPEDHRNKPGWLNNLGMFFLSRFEHKRVPSDLEESIKNFQQAVLLAPDGHPRKPEFLNGLGCSFHSQFQHTGRSTDLEEAIKYQQQAVALAPDSHLRKPVWLTNLGNSFSRRFDHAGLSSDLNEAIIHFRSAATSGTSSPSVQARAARRWASHAVICGDLHSAEAAYERAIDLIQQVAWIGESVATRHAQLHKLGDLPREAAAFALDIGKPDLALEWLEQGRSVVWNQLLNLRTSTVELRQAYPDICAEFTQVSYELRSAVAQEQPVDIAELPANATVFLEEQTQRRHRLAEKWDSLVRRIRSLPCFENFLSPRKVSVLKEAAESGPVVVINVHQRRCDALVLEPGRDEVHHIPLDKLRYEGVEKMRKMLREYSANSYLARRGTRGAGPPVIVEGSYMTGILGKLYSNIVDPVLQDLDLKTVKPDSLGLPRIWWCPIGPLTFLPLHAAGREIGGEREEASNYVVSSYIPTVNTLLAARAIKRRTFKRLVGIAMINSSDLISLPSAEAELAEIERISLVSPPRWRFQVLRNEQATGQRVLAKMRKSDWVHLACHAVQDVKEPTRSGLCLHDQRLTITDIIAKPFTHADLAFLSACETATGDEKISDEAVHITGAMLGAGYRSVIGTMWSIPDEIAPIVAEKFYGALLSGEEPDSEQAARALHESVKELRKLNQEEWPYSWVPFVHYGV